MELGQRKGKIVVEFASIDDLERIVKVMNPAASVQEPAELAGSTGVITAVGSGQAQPD